MPTIQELKDRLHGNTPHQQQIRADLARSRDELMFGDERARKLRSPVFVPFDDGWCQATKRYGEQNSIGADFLKAKLKATHSRDARDLGRFYRLILELKEPV
jgi:hypothetical protein